MADLAEQKQRAIDLGNELCDRLAEETDPKVVLSASAALLAQQIVDCTKPGTDPIDFYELSIRPMFEEILKQMVRGRAQ